MPSFDQTTLRTESLLLRPLRESDAGALFAIFADPHVARYLSRPPWTSIAIAHERIARDIEAMSVGRYACFGIEHAADGKLLGECSLFNLQEQCRRAEIGYALSFEAWGKGHMNEALRSLLEFGFSRLGLNRVEADIDPRNLASAKSLERLGFKKEGHLRERWIVAGEVSDSGLYGLLASEWKSKARTGQETEPDSFIRSRTPLPRGGFMPTVVQVPATLQQLDQVRALMRSFIAWHKERHREDIHLIDAYFDAGAFEHELATLPGKYVPPRGQLLLATLEGAPAGCVAMREIDSTSCEMKRMFVYPRFHGQGVGHALAVALIKEARTLGYRTMRLDTSIRQDEAKGLYRRLGFKSVEPYYEVPEEMRAWLMFMELVL